MLTQQRIWRLIHRCSHLSVRCVLWISYWIIIHLPPLKGILSWAPDNSYIWFSSIHLYWDRAIFDHRNSLRSTAHNIIIKLSSPLKTLSVSVGHLSTSCSLLLYISWSSTAHSCHNRKYWITPHSFRFRKHSSTGGHASTHGKCSPSTGCMLTRDKIAPHSTVSANTLLRMISVV